MRKQFVHWLFFCLALVSAGVVEAQTKDFTLKLDNYRGDVQWEQSYDKITWTNITGASTANFTTQPSKTTYYRAKITEQGCSPIYSGVKAAFIQDKAIISARLITGKIVLPSGSVINPESLTAFSTLDSCKIRQDSSFELLIADTIKENLLFAVDGKGDILMLGYFIGSQTQYLITTESTGIALLMIYPFQKPIATEKKPTLINQFKSDTSFQKLQDEINKVIKGSGKLFSETNKDLADASLVLLKRDYNKIRLRNAEGKPQFRITGSTVAVDNLGSYTFVGGIYKMPENINVKPFMVAGSILYNSSFLKYGRPAEYKLDKDDMDFIRTFDLSSFGYQNTKYEIRLRSGLAFDNSDEDKLALDENTYELTMTLFELISPDISNITNNDCRSAVISSLKSHISSAVALNPKTNLIKDVYDPFLTETYTTLVDCNNDVNPFFKFFKYVFKVINLYKQLEGLEKVSFGYFDWVNGDKKRDYCSILYENKAVDCFIVKSQTSLKQEYFTGDSVKIEILTEADPKYYPYETGNPKSVDFYWIDLKGGGGFERVPSGPVYQGKTNLSGKASINWFMPCTAGEVKAGVTFGISHPYTPPDNLFATKTVIPDLITVSSNNEQVGSPSKDLEYPLFIFVKYGNGLTDILPKSYYSVSWKNIKGTGSVRETSPDNISYYWKLGPEEGEQVMEATITAKYCNWPIKSNVIIFKATTALDTLAILQSQTWKSTEALWMNFQLGAWNDFSDDVGPCGTISYQMVFEEIYTTFVPSGDFKWSFKGSYKGDSLVNDSTCQIVRVEWNNKTEAIPLAWKWEYIPSLKIVRVTNTDDDDALDLVKGENFDFQIISLTETEIEILGTMPYSGAVTRLKLRPK
ncbi:hypothetical protein ESA94_01865 [Lacibacter luteus]|uniref:Uncharacterized protein n=1 Tax=Lacibacter luteus TaxID=2508719 RepID=A0A4V1M7W6_9BACT|nr:hypothetical protein [Lacibacter luteus]RXK61782.1 hypothetical protein ESA94_01865 [Lacibacter luteus]